MVTRWRFRAKAWECTPEPGIPPAAIVCRSVFWRPQRPGAAAGRETGGLVWETFYRPGLFPTKHGRTASTSARRTDVYALEAATGKRLDVPGGAPANESISQQAFPAVVAGGVVRPGPVYAAAGMAHTTALRLALDAASGRRKWHNDTSGKISDVTGMAWPQGNSPSAAAGCVSRRRGIRVRPL